MMNIKEVEIQKEYVRKWICASTNNEMCVRVCVQRVEEKNAPLLQLSPNVRPKKYFSVFKSNEKNELK